jgi:hypothetical protein
MNSLFRYLLEINITLLILYTAYILFFERDRNFMIRRVYLLGVMVLPFLVPLIPQALRSQVGNLSPFTFNLAELTFSAEGNPGGTGGGIEATRILMYIYLLVAGTGIAKLFLQLMRITRAINHSDRMVVEGTTVITNPSFHASSFFGYIFLDPGAMNRSSFKHILDHEKVHKREWHSVDRILAELFVMINWLNPVAWLIRKSVIENLEFMADSLVVGRGTDPVKYQLSILNQYMGSASLTNQFSSQIKNRINMLNKNYKPGSSWKIALVFPLICIAFVAISCAEKESEGDTVASRITEMPEPGDVMALTLANEELFYVVEDMPLFNGGDPATEFRKYIAQNLRYPEEAMEHGITGKVYVKFIVTSTGKLVIPQKEYLAKQEGKTLGEVVVVSFRPSDSAENPPAEKYVRMLEDEVVRVISESPDWVPGRQRGKPVNVLYTFPVNFVLQ